MRLALRRIKPRHPNHHRRRHRPHRIEHRSRHASAERWRTRWLSCPGQYRNCPIIACYVRRAADSASAARRKRSAITPAQGSHARSIGATTAAGAEPVRGALSIPITNAELRRLDVELDFLEHQMIGERHRPRAREPAPPEQRQHLPEPPHPRGPEPSRPFIGRGRRPPFVAGLGFVAKPRTSNTVSPAGFGIHAPAPVTVAVDGIALVGTAPPAPARGSIRIAPCLDCLA